MSAQLDAALLPALLLQAHVTGTTMLCWCRRNQCTTIGRRLRSRRPRCRSGFSVNKFDSGSRARRLLQNIARILLSSWYWSFLSFHSRKRRRPRRRCRARTRMRSAMPLRRICEKQNYVNSCHDAQCPRKISNGKHAVFWFEERRLRDASKVRARLSLEMR